jgi:hypothetical protein
MKILFSFCIRLFISFVAAKMLLRAVGADTLGYLMGLTLILLANIYWFDLLHYREYRYQRGQGPEKAALPEIPEEVSPNTAYAPTGSSPKIIER